jgi:hypothetical protein
VKPLASPVVEYRLMGIAQIVGGVVFALVGAVTVGPLVAVLELVFVGAFFGSWMYVLAYRRFVRRAVGGPAAAGSAEREPAGRMRRRVGLTISALLIFMAAVAVVTDTVALAGGIAAGNGAALLLSSRWLQRWERQHHTRLLREPRWRWSRKGPRGWGRGRGTMDSQDFYVVDSPA